MADLRSFVCMLNDSMTAIKMCDLIQSKAISVVLRFCLVARVSVSVGLQARVTRVANFCGDV